MALARNLDQNSSLQQQILSSNDRIAQLESMNSQLKGTVQQREEMTSQARDEIDILRRQLRYLLLLLPLSVVCLSGLWSLQIQGDHLSGKAGKPGDVGYFDTRCGSIWDFTKSE